MVFVVFALKKLCVPERGLQEAFQKHKPAFGLAINQKDLSRLSGFIRQSVTVSHGSLQRCQNLKPQVTTDQQSEEQGIWHRAQLAFFFLYRPRRPADLGSGSSSG